MHRLPPYLWVGFDGPTLPDWLAADLAEHRIHGVVLFAGRRDEHGNEQLGRNIISLDQVTELTASIQACREETIPIAIDCEGGRVTRLGPLLEPGRWPSARALAQAGLEEARRAYADMATTLHELGINVDFAPCIDVHDPNCPIIGGMERAYSESTDTIVEMASIMIDTLRNQHILPVLKHFPGHGRTHADTHLGGVDASSRWQVDELHPYERLLKRHPGPVMLAHTVNRQLDPDGLPMSLSPAATTWLRKQQPDVITITDDLNMAAISQQYSAQELAQHLSTANVDIAIHAQPTLDWLDAFYAAKCVQRCEEGFTAPIDARADRVAALFGG